MNIDNFSNEIVSLYEVIQKEIDKKRIDFIEDGYLEQPRINYEYINLDFIFDRLIDAIPPILEFYKDGRYRHIKRQIYCVFIAALCEISKRGFSQGGILKQIDEYIGFEFDRNKYYTLIKLALESENIKILSNSGHQYEATIIYESGIPKNIHRDVYSMFKVYWKWMRGIDSEERRDFLRALIEKKNFNEAYIFDSGDRKKLYTLRDSMSSFQEKVIKTCIRIDRIYSEIDKIGIEVNKDNIDKLCTEISERLGYNILTVINENELKSDLIDYAHCISFNKFKSILENLPPDEIIEIPTGEKVCCSQYNDFICGYHRIRHITYEVVFFYGLKCKDYFELPRREIIERNEHYIYVSNEPFLVEIDGYEIAVRELIWRDQILYVFAGKIPTASSAYIDGKIIHCVIDIKLQVSIRKSWDKIERKNKLMLHLDEIKVFNPKYAMQVVEISCNASKKKILKQINQRGHCRVTEKWIELEQLPDIIEVEAKINSNVVASKTVKLLPVYVYSLQTGNKVESKIDWSEWYSDNRIVIFSKQRITKTNIKVTFQDNFFEMYVYLGSFDFTMESIEFNDTSISIVKENAPKIKLCSEVICYENSICIPSGSPLKFSAINCTEDNLYLKISHGEERYKGILLNEIDDLEEFNIADCNINVVDYYGKWIVSLYREQERICSITFFVLAAIEVQLCKEIYYEGENVSAIINASNPCFNTDGELTKNCKLTIGKASLAIEGNHVVAEMIEFEITDTNCNVQYQLCAKPKVWGIRIQKDYDSLEYVNRNFQINLSSKERYELIACSTISQRILISSSDIEIQRFINPGFNIISWRYLKDNWQRINDFIIYNYYGEGIQFQVVYEPAIIYRKTVKTNDLWKMTYKYMGPIGTIINLVVFSNDIKIAKLVRIAEISQFNINLIIDNINKYKDQVLVVQARFDDEDPEVIFSTKIKLEEAINSIFEKEIIENDMKHCEYDKVVDLRDYLKTLKIINYKNPHSLISFKTLSIIKCLRGGNMI